MNRIALFESSGRTDAIDWAERTAEILKNYGAECFAVPELVDNFKTQMKSFVKTIQFEEFEKQVDIIISFGGDGTILSAARKMIRSDLPIMGINVGRLGFLAEYSIHEMDKSISDLLNGNFRIVPRSVLEAKIDNDTMFALNDFVIEKKDSSHMITVQAYANENFIGDYRADGLILTTPTGSTAYSLSCGGPIIAPSTNVFCLTPISPHTLTLRPLVISDSNEVRLKVISLTGEANLVADGQVERILKNNQVVLIRKSDAIVKLIKPTQSSYYDLLRKKLLWAVNAVDEKII